MDETWNSFPCLNIERKELLASIAEDLKKEEEKAKTQLRNTANQENIVNALWFQLLRSLNESRNMLQAVPHTHKIINQMVHNSHNNWQPMTVRLKD